MPFFAVSSIGPVLGLACCLAFLGACQKKNEPSLPKANVETVSGEPDSVQALDSAGGTQTDGVDTAMAEAGDTAAAGMAPAADATLRFSSRPNLKAYPGNTWQYRPTVFAAGPLRVRVVTAPDSSMHSDKGLVTWTPTQVGRFPVVLEAVLPPGAVSMAKAEKTERTENAGKDSMRVRQSFTIVVEKVLTLVLKPLPAQAGKGEPVSFDLRQSVFPAWSSPHITVRFDYQGDGHWDTEPLALSANLLHRHAYPGVGTFAPKVEARYLELEIRTAEGAISVISPVMPVLRMSPDTVEPGGSVTIDASGSKGDGTLSFALDLNGDGKPEWRDSLSAKAVLKAPASGTYTAVLTARNPMGQEGRVEAVLRVNARPKLDVKVRNPKENMSAAVEFKARAKDQDDSLVQVRFNFTGDSAGWETRRAAPDSQAGPGEWWLRFKHAYGKIGIHNAGICVTSADGREACQKTRIEIFNAPPTCSPGPDLKAILGKPMQIDGSGGDPDGRIVKWEWDLDGDGKYDLVSAQDGKFQYTFSREGVFPLTLKVTSADGATATGSRKVEVRKKWKS